MPEIGPARLAWAAPIAGLTTTVVVLTRYSDCLSKNGSGVAKIEMAEKAGGTWSGDGFASGASSRSDL
jgi:hypothetical protein